MGQEAGCCVPTKDKDLDDLKKKSKLNKDKPATPIGAYGDEHGLFSNSQIERKSKIEHYRNASGELETNANLES